MNPRNKFFENYDNRPNLTTPAIYLCARTPKTFEERRLIHFILHVTSIKRKIFSSRFNEGNVLWRVRDI